VQLLGYSNSSNRNKKETHKITRHLTVSDLRNAEVGLVRKAQRDEYSKEIETLVKKKGIPIAAT